MFDHRVVDLPPLHIERMDFETPSILAPMIAELRKGVAAREKTKYQQALEKWRVNHMRKPVDQRPPQPTAPNDIQRTKTPNHQLRILADFPYLIHYLFDSNTGVQIADAFTQEDINERKDLFLEDLDNILKSTPKYQGLLDILHGNVEVGLSTSGHVDRSECIPLRSFHHQSGTYSVFHITSQVLEPSVDL